MTDTCESHAVFQVKSRPIATRIYRAFFSRKEVTEELYIIDQADCFYGLRKEIVADRGVKVNEKNLDQALALKIDRKTYLKLMEAHVLTLEESILEKAKASLDARGSNYQGSSGAETGMKEEIKKEIERKNQGQPDWLAGMINKAAEYAQKISDSDDFILIDILGNSTISPLNKEKFDYIRSELRNHFSLIQRRYFT